MPILAIGRRSKILSIRGGFQMKTLAASLLLLALSCSLSSQSIFKPHKGERPLLKPGTWSDQERANRGNPCGEYFMFEGTSDPPKPAERWPAKVISTKVPITAEEDRTGVTFLTSLNTRLLVIQFDNEKPAPTAEWVFPSQESGFAGRLLIRISMREYAASPCLASSGIQIRYTDAE